MDCFYVNATECDGVYSRSVYRKKLDNITPRQEIFPTRQNGEVSPGEKLFVQ